jgi:hypothetical protein
VYASPAQASVFTLDHYDVLLNTSDPGLVLWSRDVLPDGYQFTLNTVGQSTTVNLFQIGTRETQLNWDDLVPETINVSFAFSSPPPPFDTEADGITGAFQWGSATNPFGYVVWDNPLLVAFGTTGLLGITLEHETFSLPGSAYVSATFTLLSEDTGGSPTPVPEPSTMILFGSGAAAMALRRRRLSAIRLWPKS